MLSYRRQEAAALRRGENSAGKRTEVLTAWTQQAESASPGWGGTNAKLYVTAGEHCVSSPFLNSPRGTPAPALELHTQTNNKHEGKRSLQGSRSSH